MKQQLKELKTLQNDAEIARDRSKEELINLEKRIYGDRRARDIELQNVRREADEKRQQQELFQRRIVCLLSSNIYNEKLRRGNAKLGPYQSINHQSI